MKFRTIVATVVTTICASVAVASPVDNNFHNETMLQKRRLKIKMSDDFRSESFAETFPELKELV